MNFRQKLKSFTKEFLKPTLQQSRGFSLVEILIALTLIGIAGTFVAGQIFDRLLEGQISATKTQIRSFENLLKDYQRKCFRFPTTEQGLDALIEKPTGGKECKAYPPSGFMTDEAIPEDPWGNEYIYEATGKKINIISPGPDQEEGTEDDISLKDLKGGKKKRGGDDE